MRDIILNEVSKASALLSGDTKVDDVKVAISLIARYDVQAAGIDKDTAAAHVRQVVRKLFPGVPLARIDRLIEHHAAHAEEYPLCVMNGIPITQQELDVVLGREGIRAKCLTFALLALAKYDTMRYPSVDYWYNGERWNELARRANLTLNEDDMCRIINRLWRDDLIGYADRVDNCSMHVLFADSDGEPVMMLNDQDFRDLGYCLRAYLGDKYTRCEDCGRWIRQKSRGRPTRFCTDCAAGNHRNVVAAYKKRHKN